MTVKIDKKPYKVTGFHGRPGEDTSTVILTPAATRTDKLARREALKVLLMPFAVWAMLPKSKSPAGSR